MNLNNKHYIFISGILFALAYVFISGFQSVYLSGFLKTTNVYATLAINFSFVTLFFLLVSIINYKNIPKTLKLIFKNYKNIALVNLTTMGSWIGFFFSVKYIEPAIFMSISNSLGPLITIIIGLIFIKSYKVNKYEYISIFGVIIFSVIMVINMLLNHSTTNINNLIIGIVMAILCGTSLTLNTIVSKKLNNNDMNPFEIMLTRFIFLIIYSIIVSGIDILIYTFINFGIIIFIISIIGSIIPLYCLQISIKRLDALSVALCLVFVPITVLIFQLFVKSIEFSYNSWICVISIFCFLVLGLLKKSIQITK